ncbi:hypothetical protein QTP88_023314 [Uroleucon formosanum]
MLQRLAVPVRPSDRDRNLLAAFAVRSEQESNQCPPTEDGFERFACPTPDKEGRFRCIDDHVLCDGFIDCPNGDDEDRKNCFFFKTTKAHLDILADALLRWARGR